TVAVVADDETRASRAGLRGTDLLEARSERQLPQAEKAARADQVITNDGSLEDLDRRVAEVMELLSDRLERGDEPGQVGHSQRPAPYPSADASPSRGMARGRSGAGYWTRDRDQP